MRKFDTTRPSPATQISSWNLQTEQQIPLSVFNPPHARNSDWLTNPVNSEPTFLLPDQTFRSIPEAEQSSLVLDQTKFGDADSKLARIPIPLPKPWKLFQSVPPNCGGKTPYCCIFGLGPIGDIGRICVPCKTNVS